jgi:hypothetical protein
MNKQILFSITLIGCITNNALTMEQNTPKPSLRELIQQRHSSKPNPMNVYEITKLEASGVLGKRRSV